MYVVLLPRKYSWYNLPTVVVILAREISSRRINWEACVHCVEPATVFIACECDYSYWSIDNDTMLLDVTWETVCEMTCVCYVLCVCGGEKNRHTEREGSVSVCPYVDACWSICRCPRIYIHTVPASRLCACACARACVRVCMLNPDPVW